MTLLPPQDAVPAEKSLDKLANDCYRLIRALSAPTNDEIEDIAACVNLIRMALASARAASPLPAASAAREQKLRELIERWREAARRYRPLECALISPEKRERTTKWMVYTICANELTAAIGAAADPASLGRAPAGAPEPE